MPMLVRHLQRRAGGAQASLGGWHVGRVAIIGSADARIDDINFLAVAADGKRVEPSINRRFENLGEERTALCGPSKLLLIRERQQFEKLG